MMNGHMDFFGNVGRFGGTGGYPSGMMNNFGWFQGFDFSTLLILGIFVLGLYFLLKNKKQPVKKESIFFNENSPVLDAAEIARLRYARGEITFDEFQIILKNIQ